MGETETKVSGELVLKKWLIILILFPVLVLAQEEDVDYLALAQILVKDGHSIRAEKTLGKITAEESNDPALYESLWGLIELKKSKYRAALKRFSKSLQLGLKNSEVYLYISEAHLQLKELDVAQVAIEKVGSEERNKLPYYLIRAEILWKKALKNQAWQVLQAAEAKGLSRSVLLKKKFYYFLEEELYQAAQALAFELVQDSNAFNDVLAMASQFRVKQQYEISLKLLQSLQFLRPKNEVVALEMAQNYLAQGKQFSAALILEESAKHNISLSFEASELLRQIGKGYRARFLNMSITDPSKRLKQKLALFLQEDDYHSLKFMIPQLQKTQLLEDQEIRYAVAYSLFRTGDFNKSESFLNTIDRDGLFEKSIELKKEITQCEKIKWACSETI